MYVGGEEEKEFDSGVNGDMQLVYLSPEAILSGQAHWRVGLGDIPVITILSR